MCRDLFVLRILSLIVFCLTHYRLSILVSLENMLNFSGLWRLKVNTFFGRQLIGFSKYFPMCSWFLSKLNCTHFVYTSIHKSSYYCAFVIFVAGTFVSLLFLLFSSYLAASWNLSIQLTSLHAPLSMLQWTSSMKILVTHQSASYVHYQTMLKYL